MFRFVVLAVVSMVALGGAAAGAQGPTQPEVRANIAYGPDPAQHLDLCIPPAGFPAGQPAMLMIHGGYWTVGDRSAYAEACRMAAGEVYGQGDDIDYRLDRRQPPYFLAGAGDRRT